MRALLLAAAACRVPLLDEPPVLVALNGVAPAANPWDANLETSARVHLPRLDGDVLELRVVARDPEGDPFEVWFPGNLGTIDFDPHGTRGRWVLPGPDPEGRRPAPSLNLVLRHPEDDVASSLYVVTFGR